MWLRRGGLPGLAAIAGSDSSRRSDPKALVYRLSPTVGCRVIVCSDR